MKKYFLLIAAAATVFAVSCRKAREVEQVTTETPQEEIDDTTPQPMLFGSSLNVTVDTKAAIDKFTNAGQDLYVWGFEKNGDGKFTVAQVGQTEEYKAFIHNVKAESPATADYHPEVYPINVYKNVTAGEFFYYKENTNYDFLAYYLGDAYVEAQPAADAVLYANVDEYNADHDPDISAEDFGNLSDEQKVKTPAHDAIAEVVPTVDHTSGVVNTVTIPVTIDGTNDIMLAKTDHEFDLNHRTNQDKYVADARMYSAYSARRTVVPNLKFEHQLSRFIIKTKVGGTVPYDKITIEKIEIQSKADGVLYLYGTPTDHLNFEPTSAAEDVWLPLKTNAGVVATGHPGENDYVQLGESIMAFSGEEEYDALIHLSQEGVSELEPVPVTIKLTTLEPGHKAVPGHQYTVNVIVYGAEKVEVTVSITQWVDAGNVDIDWDADDPEDPRAANTLALSLASPALSIAQNGESAEFTVTANNGGAISGICETDGIALVPVNHAAVLYANVDAYNTAKNTTLSAEEFAALTDEQKTITAAYTGYKVTVANTVAVTGENEPYVLTVKSAGTNTVKPGTVNIAITVTPAS